jgi:hypothetical protein
MGAEINPVPPLSLKVQSFVPPEFFCLRVLMVGKPSCLLRRLKKGLSPEVHPSCFAIGCLFYLIYIFSINLKNPANHLIFFCFLTRDKNKRSEHINPDNQKWGISALPAGKTLKKQGAEQRKWRLSALLHI